MAYSWVNDHKNEYMMVPLTVRAGLVANKMGFCYSHNTYTMNTCYLMSDSPGKSCEDQIGFFNLIDSPDKEIKTIEDYHFHLVPELGQCPQSHPYAYRPVMDFDYCCRSGNDNNGNAGINSGDRSARANSCQGDDYLTCPQPPCSDYAPGGAHVKSRYGPRGPTCTCTQHEGCGQDACNANPGLDLDTRRVGNAEDAIVNAMLNLLTGNKAVAALCTPPGGLLEATAIMNETFARRLGA